MDNKLAGYIKQIQSVTAEVVTLLAACRFDKLSLLTSPESCPPAQLLHWINESGLCLSLPPDAAFADVEYRFADGIRKPWKSGAPFPPGARRHNLVIFEREDKSWSFGFGSWVVMFDVWIQPCIRSEYTLEMSIAECVDRKTFRPTLDNLHIL